MKVSNLPFVHLLSGFPLHETSPKHRYENILCRRLCIRLSCRHRSIRHGLLRWRLWCHRTGRKCLRNGLGNAVRWRWTPSGTLLNRIFPLALQRSGAPLGRGASGSTTPSWTRFRVALTSLLALLRSGGNSWRPAWSNPVVPTRWPRTWSLGLCAARRRPWCNSCAICSPGGCFCEWTRRGWFRHTVATCICFGRHAILRVGQ